MSQKNADKNYDWIPNLLTSHMIKFMRRNKVHKSNLLTYGLEQRLSIII